MNTWIFVGAVLTLFFVGVFSAHAVEAARVTVDRRSFLAAIDMVESGGRDSARGMAGELGRYQLTPAVWSQHTKAPFRHARRRVFAHAIAERHFDWLVSCLLAANRPATVENMALCWNAGFTAVKNNRLLPAHRDYAERVRNLVEDFNREGAQ